MYAKKPWKGCYDGYLGYCPLIIEGCVLSVVLKFISNKSLVCDLAKGSGFNVATQFVNLLLISRGPWKSRSSP